MWLINKKIIFSCSPTLMDPKGHKISKHVKHKHTKKNLNWTFFQTFQKAFAFLLWNVRPTILHSSRNDDSIKVCEGKCSQLRHFALRGPDCVT